MSRLESWKQVEKESFIRKMNAKHLVMVSLGGVIGTGIFLSSSYLIQTARAMRTIIAYIVGACLVTLVMMCLGELSVHEPHTSSFHNYATKYIHQVWDLWWRGCIG